MAEYKVMWEIDIEADSPREAAEKAKVWQQTGSWVGVFDVTDEEGTTTRVDLDEDDKDAIETFEAFSMREEGEEETVAPMMFRNHYECQKCEHKWTDDWSAQCDDDCPNCGFALSARPKAKTLTKTVT
jgi:DNA-directed RNA polymerase subunit RPC12/RpoP